MKPVSVVAALVLVLLTAACGPRIVGSQVTRFHDLPPVLAGRTFTVLPHPHQVGSLEFQEYASQAAARLAERGLVPVPDTRDPDLVVRLDYGVGEPRTIVYHDPSPFYGAFGWGWPGRRWGAGFGLGFPLGPAYEVRSYTRYDRWAEVVILDGPAWRAGRPRTVFEGRAISEGASAALPQVMPYMLTALFQNFPGVSGESVRIEVPVPE